MSIPQIRVNFEAASSADLWIEQLAEQSDPFAGPLENWPCYLDEERYGCDPDAPAFEPTAADREWLAPQELAEEAEAWEAYREMADRLDTIEAWLQAERDEALEAMHQADAPEDVVPPGVV
jgi:hypothetical protein